MDFVLENDSIAQSTQYFEQFFSKYQFGLRKGFSSQNILLSVLENFKSTIDNKKVFCALLTDQSKALGCLSPDLLLAKLNTYRFSMAALRLIKNCISNKKQKKQNKCRIQFLGRYFLWSPPRVHSKTSSFQNFS